MSFLLSFTQSRLVEQARLRHVLVAFSALHYPGTVHAEWSGDARRGTWVLDDLSGDTLAFGWGPEGLVVLVFAHESERSEYGHSKRSPLRWLPDLPPTLQGLAEQVAERLDQLATAGLWVVGDAPAHLSGGVSIEHAWAHGLELLFSFGLSSRQAVFGEHPHNWAELHSLHPDQSKLAIALARRAGLGSARVRAAESTRLIMLPTPDANPVTLDAAAQTRSLLRQAGISWEIPTLELQARLQVWEDERSRRRSEGLGASMPLFDAVRAGDEACVRRYLAEGANVDAQTIENAYEYTPAGDTSLVQALKKRHSTCALLLLEYGARHDLANRYGQTALYWAAETGDVNVTRLLLERGADPGRTANDGRSPLHVAAAEGFVELVELLLAHGADRSMATWNGRNPAEIARLRGHIELADRLTP